MEAACPVVLYDQTAETVGPLGDKCYGFSTHIFRVVRTSVLLLVVASVSCAAIGQVFVTKAMCQ
jgi:hypothetical protein